MEELKSLGEVIALAAWFYYALAIGVLLLIILIPVLLHLRKKARQAERSGERKRAVPRWIAFAVLSIPCGLIAFFIVVALLSDL